MSNEDVALSMERRRNKRVLTIDSQRLAVTYPERATGAAGDAPGSSGYYDDRSGGTGYVPFFTLGVSAFGDGSVLR